MGVRIANAGAVCSSGKAIKVMAPDKVIWFFRPEGESMFHVWEPGERNPVAEVTRELVERVANHPENCYETVPVDRSPFRGGWD